MSAQAGTAIIGGGIVGLCVALGLAARGHEVLVLDGRDGDMRASQGNFGLVWLQGKGAGYAPLSLIHIWLRVMIPAVRPNWLSLAIDSASA